MKRKLTIVFVLITFFIMALVFYLRPNFSPEKIKSNSQGQNQNDQPPVLIQNIGVDFEDFEFTHDPLTFNALWMDYGFLIPANSMGPAKKNPQPTFILPMGTKVHSLINGIVVDIPKLYSGDYSVMVAPEKDSQWAYETEHVINVTVSVGDEVKAGQVVAEVSDFDAHNFSGYGMVEIGILRGGNPPKHLCPFKYLDPSIKEDVDRKILDLYASWEKYRGDENIYDQEDFASPGCISDDEIGG